MWKLWHKLFGMHFVVFRYGDCDLVRLVRFDLNGRPFVKIYGQFYWLLVAENSWDGLTFDKQPWLKSFDKPALRAVHQ